MPLAGKQFEAPGEGGGAGAPPPPLSVVMPVHNAMPYLDESIRSILGQTFTDFEFVILDDASTDGSTTALRAWAEKDNRIRVYRSARKMGLSSSSNLVVRHARGALVARMDADDVSHPERLMRQREVMRSQPDVALVGTLCDGIDSAGHRVRPRDRWRLLRCSTFAPFPHGSVMFRRKTFDEVGGYREEWAGLEDQDLFLRLARRGRVVALPDLLYRYRYHLNCASLSSAVTDAVLANGSRRGLEAGLAKSAGERKVSASAMDTSALRSAGALRLWAGHSPGVLRHLLARSTFEWNMETMRALIWAAWGGLSPGSLRACLRCLIRARDLLAGTRLRDGRVCEWRFE